MEVTGGVFEPEIKVNDNGTHLLIIAITHILMPGSVQLLPQEETVAAFTKNRRAMVNPEDLLVETRRWLQAGENPYPGYCRAPGSSICVDTLCNCNTLWKMFQKHQKNGKKKDGSEGPKKA